LRYNNNGEYYQIAWNQSGTNRYYSQIHPDNQANISGLNNDPTMEDHIGGVGAVRIAKALWWLLARMAGLIYNRATVADWYSPSLLINCPVFYCRFITIRLSLN